MSSNLKVNTILPSVGSNIGIGTNGGELNVDGGCKVQVGTALTLGHSIGLQYATQNLHSEGFEINQINASGIVTASHFYGNGANLTSLPTQVTIANNADNRVITGGSGVNLNGEDDVQIDSSGRLSVGNSQASTQYGGSNDLVIGNTTGDHGITIISNTNNRGRLMFSRTYSADTQRYDGQILYDHQTTTMNFYSNYTNNQAVAMQLGGSENQLFVGIDKGSTTTWATRSAFFHRGGGNYVSITTGGSDDCGVTFGDSIANGSGNYESYIQHQNSTNDLVLRVNQGNDNRHLKIKQGGNVEIGNGNLVLADGHGIDFSADGNTSGMTSEVLDDYETGTWTPDVVAGSGSDVWNYRRAGRYTKIGNKVTASWSLGQYDGNLSGDVFISNLPFTIDFRQYGGDIGFYDIDVPSGTIIGYFVYLDNNTTHVRPYWTRAGQQGTPVEGGDLRNSNQTFWEGNVTYYTNS